MTFVLTPEQLDSLENHDWENTGDMWGEEAYSALASALWRRFDVEKWLGYVALMHTHNPRLAPSDEFCFRVAASYHHQSNTPAVTPEELATTRRAEAYEYIRAGLMPPPATHDFTIKQLIGFVTYSGASKSSGFMNLLPAHPSVDHKFWNWVRGYIQKDRLLRHYEKIDHTFLEAVVLNPDTPADIINCVAKYVSGGMQELGKITTEKALWWPKWLGSVLHYRDDISWVNRKFRLPAISSTTFVSRTEASLPGLLLTRAGGIPMDTYMGQKFGVQEEELGFWRDGLVRNRTLYQPNSEAFPTVLATQNGIGRNGIPGYAALYVAAWWLIGEGRELRMRGRGGHEYWGLPYLSSAKRWMESESGLDDSVPFEWLMEMLGCHPGESAVDPGYDFTAPSRIKAA